MCMRPLPPDRRTHVKSYYGKAGEPLTCLDTGPAQSSSPCRVRLSGGTRPTQQPQCAAQLMEARQVSCCLRLSLLEQD